MKSRERKQEDLTALTEQFKNSKSAVVLSFNGLTVDKDQQFRNELRETGATYRVVKNTLARKAVKDTAFEEATEHFKGVTSVAWTDEEPVDLSKVISKYLREEKDVFEFKTGIVDGKIVSVEEIKAIASLPSKEELIGKLLYLLNAPAQRLATVLNALPRDLAVVMKQVSERSEDPGEQSSDANKEAPAAEEAKTDAPEKAETKPEADTDEKASEAQERAEPEEKKSEEKADEKEVEKASDDAAEKKTEEKAGESEKESDEETGNDPEKTEK